MTRVDEAFYAAISSERVVSEAALLNPSTLERERERALAAAAALVSYREFLAAARARKASRRGAPLEFEREVHAQADDALQAARRLGAATLRTASHARHSGLIDETLNAWRSGAAATGAPVRLRDVLADAFDDPAARSALERAGLARHLKTELANALEPVEFATSVRDGNLSVALPTGEAGGPRAITLGRDPRPGRPRTVTDLLTQEQFDAIALSLDEPGASPGDVAAGVRPAAAGAVPSDTVLTGVMMVVAELARHRRGLADAGLATHAGDDPATAIVVLVAGAVLIIAGTVLRALCADGVEEACDWSVILYGLGLFVIAGAVCLTPGNPGVCAGLIGVALSYVANVIDA